MSKPLVAYSPGQHTRALSSGLGIDAQHAARRQVRRRLEISSLIAEFAEIEIGARARRRLTAVRSSPPRLQRLARHGRGLPPPPFRSSIGSAATIYFVSGLARRLRVPFRVAQLEPPFEPFMLRLHAALAERSRREGHQRTHTIGSSRRRRRGSRTGPREITSPSPPPAPHNAAPRVERARHCNGSREKMESLRHGGERTASRCAAMTWR